MPINLTVAQVLTNGTRLTITAVRYLEDEQIIAYTAAMRTATGGTPPDAEVAAVRAEIRVGFSDVVSRVTLPTGARLTALLAVSMATLPTNSTQFAAAVTAFKANKATFEAHLLTAGYLHSSLAGT